MSALLQRFAEEPEYLIGLTAVVFAFVIAMTIAIACTVTTVKNRRAQEQSRREIAAYVAEGTISAEDAEKLLHPSPWYARGAKSVGQKLRGFNPGSPPGA